MASRLGTTLLNRFTLREELAMGGSGAVFLADIRGSMRQAVVKIAHAHLVHDEATRRHIARRFEHEAEALSTVRHPSLVRALAHGHTDDGAPFVVLRHVQGRSLQKILADGPLPTEMVPWLFQQLFEVTAALHEHGIIHRDITPANVIVQARDQRAVLLDLGIARLQGQTIGTIGSIGTPRFVAPEQIRGEPLAASDLFSIGALMWVALTGESHLVGDAQTPSGTLLARQLMAAGPPDAQRLPDLPRSLTRLLCRLLSPDPAVRPTARQAIDSWRQVSASWAPLARAPSPEQRMQAPGWMPSLVPSRPLALDAGEIARHRARPAAELDAAQHALVDLPPRLARLEQAVAARDLADVHRIAAALAELAVHHGAHRLAELADLLARIAGADVPGAMGPLLTCLHEAYTTELLHVLAAGDAEQA